MSEIRRTHVSIVKEIRYSSSSDDESDQSSEPSLCIPNFTGRVSKWQPYDVMSNIERRIRRSVFARNFEPDEPPVLGCNSTPDRNIRQSVGPNTTLSLSPIVANTTVSHEEENEDAPTCTEALPLDTAKECPSQRRAIRNDVFSTITNMVTADFGDDCPEENRWNRELTWSEVQGPGLATLVQQKVYHSWDTDTLREQLLKAAGRYVDSESFLSSSCSEMLEELERTLNELNNDFNNPKTNFIYWRAQPKVKILSELKNIGQVHSTSLHNSDSPMYCAGSWISRIIDSLWEAKNRSSLKQSKYVKGNKNANAVSVYRRNSWKTGGERTTQYTKQKNIGTTPSEKVHPKVFADQNMGDDEAVGNDERISEVGTSLEDRPTGRKAVTKRLGVDVAEVLGLGEADVAPPAKKNRGSPRKNQNTLTVGEGQPKRIGLIKSPGSCNKDRKSLVEDFIGLAYPTEKKDPPKGRANRNGDENQETDLDVITESIEVRYKSDDEENLSMEEDGPRPEESKIKIKSRLTSKKVAVGRPRTVAKYGQNGDRFKENKENSGLSLNKSSKIGKPPTSASPAKKKRGRPRKNLNTLTIGGSELKRARRLKSLGSRNKDQKTLVEDFIGLVSPTKKKDLSKGTAAEGDKNQETNLNVIAESALVRYESDDGQNPSVEDEGPLPEESKAKTKSRLTPKQTGRVGRSRTVVKYDHKGDGLKANAENSRLSLKKSNKVGLPPTPTSPAKKKRGRPRKNLNILTVGKSDLKKARLLKLLGSRNKDQKSLVEDFIGLVSSTEKKDPPKGRANRNGDENQETNLNVIAESALVTYKESDDWQNRSLEEEGPLPEESQVKTKSRLTPKKTGRVGRSRTVVKYDHKGDGLKAYKENSRLTLKKSNKVGLPPTSALPAKKKQGRPRKNLNTLTVGESELKRARLLKSLGSRNNDQKSLVEDFIGLVSPTEKKDPPKGRANQNGDENQEMDLDVISESAVVRYKSNDGQNLSVEKEGLLPKVAKARIKSKLAPKKTGRVGRPRTVVKYDHEGDRLKANEESLRLTLKKSNKVGQLPTPASPAKKKQRRSGANERTRLQKLLG